MLQRAISDASKAPNVPQTPQNAPTRCLGCARRAADALMYVQNAPTRHWHFDAAWTHVPHIVSITFERFGRRRRVRCECSIIQPSSREPNGRNSECSESSAREPFEASEIKGQPGQQTSQTRTEEKLIMMQQIQGVRTMVPLQNQSSVKFHWLERTCSQQEPEETITEGLKVKPPHAGN